MCGLWGYAGAAAPDMGRLAMAARLAARRGPDAWGITTETRERRGLGRLPDDAVQTVAQNRVVLGHCRLSTVLGTKTTAACQPLRAGRFVVAHNGCVANAGKLVDRFGLSPATGNDSEVIAMLLDRLEGQAGDRLTAALRMIDHGGHYAVAVLDTADMQVLLRANGIPLWRHQTAAGTYWGSIRPGMEWEPVRG